MVGRKSADRGMEGIVMFKNFIGLFVAVMLVVGLGTTAMGQMHAVAPADPGPGHGGTSFGKKVAGSYLVDAELAPGILPPGQGLQTLTADGQLLATDNGAFLGLSPLTPQQGPFLAPIFGPGHGAWKQTGDNELTHVALLQGYWGSCDPEVGECDPALTGTQVSTCKPTAVITFDDGYRVASGTFSTVCYFAGDDPLDPDSVPFFDSAALFGPGNLTYTRISAD